MAADPQPLTVWHDGRCPFCRREIALMRRLDRRGIPANRAALLTRFHAREDGRTLVGAAAFAAVWRAIPALRPLGLAARNPVVLRVPDAGYAAFLRARPLLQAAVRRLER